MIDLGTLLVLHVCATVMALPIAWVWGNPWRR